MKYPRRGRLTATSAARPVTRSGRGPTRTRSTSTGQPGEVVVLPPQPGGALGHLVLHAFPAVLEVPPGDAAGPALDEEEDGVQQRYLQHRLPVAEDRAVDQ